MADRKKKTNNLLKNILKMVKYDIWFLLLCGLINMTFGCNSPQSTENKTINEATYRGNSQHTGVYDNEELTFPVVEKWKHNDSKKGIISAPAVADELVLYGSFDRNLYALDAASGKRKWKFETAGSILTSPVISSGIVYFGSMDGIFYALDVATGEEKWRFQTAAISLNEQEMAAVQQEAVDELFPSHNVHETELQQIGSVLANIEPATGNDLLEYGILSSPVISDGTVYFGTSSNRFYALESSTGDQLWEFIATSGINHSPAVADGTVYFSTGFELYALDANSGEKKWENQINNGFGTSPVVSNGLVLYDDGAQLNAYAAYTGKIAWSFEVSSEIGPDYGASVKDGIVFSAIARAFMQSTFSLERKNGIVLQYRPQVQAYLHQLLGTRYFSLIRQAS
jgi:outer membrane protein assembly factor BamB